MICSNGITWFFFTKTEMKPNLPLSIYIFLHCFTSLIHMYKYANVYICIVDNQSKIIFEPPLQEPKLSVYISSFGLNDWRINSEPTTLQSDYKTILLKLETYNRNMWTKTNLFEKNAFMVRFAWCVHTQIIRYYLTKILYWPVHKKWEIISFR